MISNLFINYSISYEITNFYYPISSPILLYVITLPSNFELFYIFNVYTVY